MPTPPLAAPNRPARPARLRLVALASCILLPLSAHAAPVPEDYRQLNQALVEHHVLPRYAQLADAMQRLHSAAQHYCATPDNDRSELTMAWYAANDAWQAVQHIRFGPIETDSRTLRIEFWPDPRNSIGRQLDSLLAQADPHARSADNVANSSIAVQGLPALERLLTADTSGDTVPESATPRCELMVSISANLARLAQTTHDEWRAPPVAFTDVVAQAGAADGHYRFDREATQDFFKSLLTALELVADHKLSRPLGPSLASARPQLAEAWRSQRSLDYIRVNLAAAEALYLGTEQHGFAHFVREVAQDAELDMLLTKAFAQTRATAASLTLPLEHAVTHEQERAKLEQLAREAGALKTLIAQRLSQALDMPMGFNSLDGD